MRFVLALAGILLYTSLAAQDVSVRLLKDDGTPLDSAGKVFPGRLRVDITATDATRQFGIRSGEIILGREKNRVATINSAKTKLIDLTPWRSQAIPGDFILFDFMIEERKDGKTLEAFNRKFRFILR